MNLKKTDINKPTVLYDGHCGLCHRGVRFILKHTRKGQFHYFPLSSSEATEILHKASFTGPLPDALILVENGKIWLGSQAVIRIARYLKGVWVMLCFFRVMPGPWLDKLYSWVARNRYCRFCHVLNDEIG